MLNLNQIRKFFKAGIRVTFEKMLRLFSHIFKGISYTLFAQNMMNIDPSQEQQFFTLNLAGTAAWAAGEGMEALASSIDMVRVLSAAREPGSRRGVRIFNAAAVISCRGIDLTVAAFFLRFLINCLVAEEGQSVNPLGNTFIAYEIARFLQSPIITVCFQTETTMHRRKAAIYGVVDGSMRVISAFPLLVVLAAPLEVLKIAGTVSGGLRFINGLMSYLASPPILFPAPAEQVAAEEEERERVSINAPALPLDSGASEPPPADPEQGSDRGDAPSRSRKCNCVIL